MAIRAPVIARAMELARSGDYASSVEIQPVLLAEGFVWTDLLLIKGRAMQAEIRTLCDAARFPQIKASSPD